MNVHLKVGMILTSVPLILINAIFIDPFARWTLQSTQLLLLLQYSLVYTVNGYIVSYFRFLSVKYFGLS